MKNYNKLYILVALMSLYNSAADALFGYTFKNPEIAKAEHTAFVKEFRERQEKNKQRLLNERKKAINDREVVFGPKTPKYPNESYQYFKYPVTPSAPNIEDESKSDSFTVTWKEKLLHSTAQAVHLVTLTGILTHIMAECALAYAKCK